MASWWGASKLKKEKKIGYSGETTSHSSHFAMPCLYIILIVTNASILKPYFSSESLLYRHMYIWGGGNTSITSHVYFD